jgi:NAD(P)-dependent dehydrogenase (short-subunit alcohol dehydrogenase family)
MHSIKGQVAVITGAAGGIGHALALDMARRGAAAISFLSVADRAGTADLGGTAAR